VRSASQLVFGGLKKGSRYDLVSLLLIDRVVDLDR
jgi:hypothetical protein